MFASNIHYTPIVILFLGTIYSAVMQLGSFWDGLTSCASTWIPYTENAMLWARKRATDTQEVVNNVEAVGGAGAGAELQLPPLLPIVWVTSWLKERSQTAIEILRTKSKNDLNPYLFQWNLLNRRDYCNHKLKYLILIRACNSSWW